MFTNCFRPMTGTLCVLAMTACVAASPYEGVPPEDLLTMGEERVANENWGDAIEVLERLTIGFPSFERIADARYLLADAYFQDKKYFIAETLFSDFTARHGGDARAPAAALGTCRSVVERSPVYQRDQTDTRRAVIVCQGVASSYAGIDDEVSDEAAAHVNEMRYKLGEKAYMDAEFYLRFSSDSAIILFQQLIDNYPDTPWAPKAMLGIIHAFQKLEYAEEVAEWSERLRNSYPDSPEAKEIGSDAGQLAAPARPDDPRRR